MLSGGVDATGKHVAAAHPILFSVDTLLASLKAREAVRHVQVFDSAGVFLGRWALVREATEGESQNNQEGDKRVKARHHSRRIIGGLIDAREVHVVHAQLRTPLRRGVQPILLIDIDALCWLQ